MKDQDLMIRAVDAAGNVRVGTASVSTKQEMKRSGIFLPGRDKEKKENMNDSGDDTESRYGIMIAAAAVLLLLLSVRKKSDRQ